MATGDFTRINTNIGALNALNSLKAVQKELGVHQLRLATGKRINEAADDPAGYTIATKFQYRAGGLGVALDNIGDAKNMLAVAEGGLAKIKDILVQMRSKAEQAASDTMGSDERQAIGTQLADFAEEIDAIVNTTKWNGKLLLDGMTQFGASVTFQVGADTDADDVIALDTSTFASVSTAGLSIDGTTISLSSASTASEAQDVMDALDDAIEVVTGNLQVSGSVVSRLTFREETLTVAKVNVEAAYSRIMDSDMAYEQLQATKYQILQQTATAMLAQANAAPQNVLSLFRG